MIGDESAALDRNREYFRRLGLQPGPAGSAIDLGAGNGLQSIPLAELGFAVTAVDLCAPLLVELQEKAGALPIRTVHEDLLSFLQRCTDPADVVVCMGDTLTHLDSLATVEELIAESARRLAPGGLLALTFRDYVSSELRGNARFIPVRGDENQILTCFLEYHEGFVEVHDILHRREDGRWSLAVSSYRKLRLGKAWLIDRLRAAGLEIVRDAVTNGMIDLVAGKSPLASP
ncbi:MAG TPA: class I SAM-dependent methyltransferase [Thermoanaerobaculia bacterium]